MGRIERVQSGRRSHRGRIADLARGVPVVGVAVAVAVFLGSLPAWASAPYQLSVPTFGDGRVTSSPPGIDCGSKCFVSFEEGTVVTLFATAGEKWYFAGWEGGGCTGTSSCTFAVNEDMRIGARFHLKPLQRIHLRASDTHVAPGDRIKVTARLERCADGQPVTLTGGGKSRTRIANSKCRARFWMRLAKTTRLRAKVPVSENYIGGFSDMKIRVSSSG